MPDLDALFSPRYVGDVLEACGERGTRAAVIVSSGFAEERGAEGRARQERITTLAERYDMAVLGPNGEGFLNAALPLHASFSPVLTEGDPPSPPGARARGIGVISQSGGELPLLRERTPRGECARRAR